MRIIVLVCFDCVINTFVDIQLNIHCNVVESAWVILLPFNYSTFMNRFFPFFCYCLLVHIIPSPKMILKLNFSLCKINCSISGLHEDESTDGWGCGGGMGGLAKTKKILGDWETENIPWMNWQRYWSARSRLLAKIISTDVPKSFGSSLFLTRIHRFHRFSIHQIFSQVFFARMESSLVILLRDNWLFFLYQTEKSRNNEIEILFGSYSAFKKEPFVCESSFSFHQSEEIFYLVV